MNNLDKYREEIDKIDNQIIWLLKKRFDIVKNKILPYKKNFNIPFVQEKRYNSLLKNLTQNSDQIVSKKFIRTLWNIIHEYSLKLQK